MPNAASAEFSPLVSREQMDNAFHSALQMFVGRGKRHRAEDVAVGAGVPRRILDCYRGYPIGHPDHRTLDEGQKWSIASYIGADLTSRWIAAIGQGAFDLPDGSEGDLDTAAIEAGEFQQAVQKARHPASPGGTAIVSQELGEIVPLARRSAASVQKVMAA